MHNTASACNAYQLVWLAAKEPDQARRRLSHVKGSCIAPDRTGYMRLYAMLGHAVAYGASPWWMFCMKQQRRATKKGGQVIWQVDAG